MTGSASEMGVTANEGDDTDSSRISPAPVWELRIHGVSNTPPESVLRTLGDHLPPDGQEPALRLVAGDATTGFYRYVPPAPGEPGFEVEAFSWGQLTSGRRVNGDRVAKDLRRAGWALLLPFALVNVALWARPEMSAKPGDKGSAWLLAGVVRVMALSMSLTLIAAAAGASMDFGTWQCHGDCGRTPPGLSMLNELGRDGRLAAVGALVPLAVLAGLLWLSGKTFQYETVRSPPPADKAAAEHPLADPAFWSGDRQVRGLRRWHAAAALALVAHLLAASVWAAPEGSAEVGAVSVSITAAAILALAGGAVLQHSHFARSDEEPTRVPPRGSPGWPGVLLRTRRLSAGTLTAWTALVLTVVALWIAWRGPGPAGGAGRLPGYEATVRGIFVAQVLLLLVGLAVNDIAARRLRSESRNRPAAPAWSGRGAVLFMGAGWVTGLLFSLAVLFGAAWWLNGGENGGARAVVSPTLQWAAVGLAVGFAFLAAAALVAAWRIHRLSSLERAPIVQAGPPTWTPSNHEEAAIRVATRWRALHRFDGYEVFTVVGWLAVALLAVAVLGLAVGFTQIATLWAEGSRWTGWVASPAAERGSLTPAPGWGWLDFDLMWLSNAGGFLAVGAMAALVLLVGSAYRIAAVRRVVGVVWDVVTFWPRGAHPLAPPCYAERAVPLLLTRLDGLKEHPVVLAGHSQGAVIAAACVFQLDEDRRRRTYLLTFGTQLTRFYGRAFPAVFGWEQRQQLAGALTDGPGGLRWRSLWRATDPLGWPVFASEHHDGGGAAGPDEPVDRQVRDPEGFAPADPGEVLDPPVRQHSGYPLCPEYLAVRWEAATALNDERFSAPGTPRPGSASRAPGDHRHSRVGRPDGVAPPST